MRAKAQQTVAAKPRRHTSTGSVQRLIPEQLKRCLTWASLIKLVYEALC